MDFDAFEKEQDGKEQKPAASKKTASDCCSRPAGRAADGLLDAFEDWEEYMQFGMGGRPGRDHFGFHLPYRDRNDA